MRGLRVPWRANLALVGVMALGCLTLVLSFPAERLIGAMFEADQQLEEAARYYQRWSRRFPADYEARWHAAELLLQTARPEEAVAELESMHHDWPDDRRILERLIEIEDSLLRVEEVVPRLEAIVAAHPEDPRLVSRLADHYRWFGEREKLVKMLHRLNQLGDFPDERDELIDILFGQRRYDELIALFSRDLEEMANPAPARLALYEAYLRSGRTEKAAAELRALIDLEPEEITYVRELGELFIDAGRLADAIALYEDVAERIGDEPDGRVELAGLYQSAAEHLAERGQVAGAIALQRKRIALVPTDVDARLDLADLHGEEADRVAVAELRSLLTEDPDSLPATLALADRLSWTGEVGEAIASYRRAVSLGGGPRARRKLAQHLHWSDRLGEAATQYGILARADLGDARQHIRVLLDAEANEAALEAARALLKRAPVAVHRKLLERAAFEGGFCDGPLDELSREAEEDREDIYAWRALRECASALGRGDALARAEARLNQLGGGVP